MQLSFFLHDWSVRKFVKIFRAGNRRICQGSVGLRRLLDPRAASCRSRGCHADLLRLARSPRDSRCAQRRVQRERCRGVGSSARTVWWRAIGA